MDLFDKENHEAYHWDLLPDLVVEQIFCYLQKRSRYNAAVTCKSWLRVLFFPELWKTFTLREKTLTRSRFDYYKGYQDKLDQFVTRICLKKVGRHFRRLRILPIADFYNLFEFMSIVDTFLTHSNDYPMYHLEAFEFSFACVIRNREGIRIFGTGGRILKTLTSLMGHFQNLKELSLENLLLERNEASTLLDSIFQSCPDSLLRLSVINCTQFGYFFMQCGLFLNLRCLTISPNHLHTDLIYLISNLRQLSEFHVVQSEFTRAAVQLHASDWIPMQRAGKHIRIFLEVKGKTKDEIVWQEKAPVCAIVYSTPYSRLTTHSALEVIHQYANSLTAFCQFGLPRFSYKRSRPFDTRMDSQLLLLVRTCIKLRVIVIHELISISTLLLIASYGRDHLREIYVRKNGVLCRHDWTSTDSLSVEFQTWLKRTSSSYDSFEEEISRILGKRWRALTDKEFRKLNLNTIDF